MKTIPRASKTFVCLCAALALAFPATPRVQAQNQSLRRFQQVAISSDGARVAWVEQGLNSEGEPATGNAIYVQELNAAGQPPRRIVANMSMASEDTVAWSPDSK